MQDLYQILRKHWYFLFFILILGASLWLQTIHLDSFRYIEADEEVWVISGASLLTSGKPKSWTVFWDTYQDYFSQYIGGKSRVVVTPFLDHPPVFQLLVGSWAVATGNIGENAFDWIELRTPMIAIGLVTILVTTLFVDRLFNRKMSMLTLVAFAFLPSFVLSSRIIAAEHLLALLMMTALLSIHVMKERYKKMGLFLAILICVIGFISPLIKLSGVIIPLTSAVLLWILHQRKLSLIVGLSLVFSVLVYLGYGWFFNYDLFLAIQQAHAEREQTFWNFFSMFGKPDLGYYFLADPYFIIGLIGSLGIFLFKEVKRTEVQAIFLTVPWFFMMLIFLVVAPAETYGWYKFILFPFIAMGLGYLYWQLLEGRIATLVLLIPGLLVLIENAAQTFEIFNIVRRPLILVFFLPMLLFLIWPKLIKNPIYPIFSYGIIGVTVVFQSVWVYTLLNSM